MRERWDFRINLRCQHELSIYCWFELVLRCAQGIQIHILAVSNSRISSRIGEWCCPPRFEQLNKVTLEPSWSRKGPSVLEPKLLDYVTVIQLL